MTDLHALLLAAVEHRLSLARAATPGPWAPDSPWLSDVVNSALLGPVADCSIGVGFRPQSLEDARHIAANDPEATIRHAEADLRRLERHQPNAVESEAAGLCADGWHDEWPCSDIRDLAAAYDVALSPHSVHTRGDTVNQTPYPLDAKTRRTMVLMVAVNGAALCRAGRPDEITEDGFAESVTRMADRFLAWVNRAEECVQVEFEADRPGYDGGPDGG